MKSRIIIVFSGLLLGWSILILRAAQLQLVPDVRLKALKARQFQTVITLQSRRGAILDRNGRELALSTTTFSLYADPKIISKPKMLSRKLAKELGMSPQTVFAKLRDTEKRFVWIQRQLSKEKSDRIKSWDERGLAVVEEYKRIYPNDQMFGHSLGFVGAEGRGLEGLELQYDSQLRGENKKVSVRRDARGRPLVADGMMFADNPDGAEMHLTLDGETQHVLEGEMEKALTDFDADQAFGVVLDASTSAIVAMASSPGMDANAAAKFGSEQRRNRVITDSFEPGSTMKTFAIAAALKHQIVQPNTKFNTENGKFKVGDRIIREAELDHKWPQLTVSEILAFSSNIGTTKIAFQLGAEKMRQNLLDFGFGSKTGVDLPGEAKGTVLPLPWNQHLLSNVSFGQGITANPLQVANAYAAIANGGVLNQPYLVQSIKDWESGETVEIKPKTLRRVLNPEDAASLRLMLTGATGPGGTGQNARVDGFLVGGKTGTAQKVNPVGRGYLSKAYISSFAGFIPASDPKYVIYIAVDHPKKNSYYGSQVAAPIFSRVASYCARRAGLVPMMISEKNLVPSLTSVVPALKSKKILSEQKSALASGLSVKSNVPDSLRTSPLQGAFLLGPNQDVMPDLRHLTMREVLRTFQGKDVQIKFQGQGKVSETYPEAGVVLRDNQKILVQLKNPTAADVR